ncbi:hypothetical protein ACIXMS_06390 [Bacteroides fragilis]
MDSSDIPGLTIHFRAFKNFINTALVSSINIVFALIARLRRGDCSPSGQRFQQAECRAERSSRYAEARKRRRTAKAFERNSKGIE